MLTNFCSYAITGPREVFQAIYTCQQCSNKNGGGDNGTTILCFCEACANECHADHDGVTYIGMGPSYCDCNKMNGEQQNCCTILTESLNKAKDLGIVSHNNNNNSLSGSYSIKNKTKDDNDTACYVRDCYQLSTLMDNESICQNLQKQAQHLVTISKETFWLDTNNESSSYCELEKLAAMILRQHSANYLLTMEKQDNSSLTTSTKSECSSNLSWGAEWWVQVKPVSHPDVQQTTTAATTIPRNNNNSNNGSEAVDLHYDKDEVIAECFGIGYFPFISTVTYLTNSCTSPPTLIFNIRYDESSVGPEESPIISEMLISNPEIGKHIVFDGRLLHGAPSHYALRPYNNSNNNNHHHCENHNNNEISNNNIACTNEEGQEIRITFLVNLWLNHKPAGIFVLPNNIRETLKGTSLTRNKKLSYSLYNQQEMKFIPSCIKTIIMNEEDVVTDTAASSNNDNNTLSGRIELPFVGGKDVTWGSSNDDPDNEDEHEDDNAPLIVMTYPPPFNYESGTTLIQFSAGLEAYLDYTEEEE